MLSLVLGGFLLQVSCVMTTLNHLIATGQDYAKLHVVCVISNPARYRSRYALYKEFAKRCEEAGAILYTVEAAFGERPYEITEAGNPQHIQLRTSAEAWNKENMLNIGIARLPLSAEYIATIDADFTFVRQDWASETIQQLQHYPVVQMFSEVVYLGPDSQVMHSRPGFAQRWMQGEIFGVQNGAVRNEALFTQRIPAAQPLHYPYPGDGDKNWGPPGGAWAYRREALNQVGGLIDFCILGAADWYMAAGACGFMERAIPQAYTESFRRELLQWQEKAKLWRKNIGVVPGMACHHWHGKMSQRGYGTREQILRQYAFDPRTDIKYDAQGLIQLHDDGSDRMRMMRDALRSYFRSRSEDSIDV